MRHDIQLGLRVQRDIFWQQIATCKLLHIVLFLKRTLSSSETVPVYDESFDITSPDLHEIFVQRQPVARWRVNLEVRPSILTRTMRPTSLQTFSGRRLHATSSTEAIGSGHTSARYSSFSASVLKTGVTYNSCNDCPENSVFGVSGKETTGTITSVTYRRSFRRRRQLPFPTGCSRLRKR